MILQEPSLNSKCLCESGKKYKHCCSLNLNITKTLSRITEKAILNIQILENGLYTRTPFVDMEFPNDLSVKLRSIAPFAGRLCLYDLMKGSETNV